MTYEESRSTSYPLDENFASYPPSPLEFPGTLTPPPLWNFQFPPWWGYGYFLETHNKNFFSSVQMADQTSQIIYLPVQMVRQTVQMPQGLFINRLSSVCFCYSNSFPLVSVLPFRVTYMNKIVAKIHHLLKGFHSK